MAIHSVKSLGPLPLLIGVTGHRNLRDQDTSPLEDVVRKIFRELQSRYPHTPLILFSPLAEGADRLVARVGLSLGVQLHVPLPMPLGLYVSDFKTDASRSEFDHLLKQADRVFELPMKAGITEEAIREPGPVRNQQYDAVGSFIAEHTQILIALWDGVASAKTGGTADIMHHRLSDLPQAAANQLHPPDPVHSGPVYQVVTPREGQPVPEGAMTLRIHFPIGLQAEKVPSAAYDKLFGQLEAFNDDSVRCSQSPGSSMEQSQSSLLPQAETQALPGAFAITRKCFGAADSLAVFFQRRMYRSVIWVFILVLAAVLLYEVLNHLLHQENLGLLLYPVALTAAYIVFYWSKWKNYANRFQDYRGLAEGLRVQFFWKLAGLTTSVEDNYLRKHRGELNWIRMAIRICWSLQGADVASVSAATGGEEKRRRMELVDRYWLSDQFAFFQRRAMAVEKRRKMLGGLVRAGLTIGLALSLIVGGALVANPQPRTGLLEWFDTHPWSRDLVGFTIALSMLGSALLQSYMENQSIPTIARQYRVMERLFETARIRFKDTPDASALPDGQRLLEALGKEALAENADWVLIHRDRPMEVPHGQ